MPNYNAKDARESEVGTEIPDCDESKSFFLDPHGLSAEPVNLFRTTFVDTLSRPRGVEFDGDVGPDSSQFLIRCGDGKTAIFLLKP